MRKLFAIILLIVLSGCAAGTVTGENAENAEIFMVNVGKADAIIVCADNEYYLIDAATEEMWGRVYAALNDMKITRLKGVFVTHTDKDHVGGLEMLAMSGIQIDAWYASRYYLDVKEEKHPCVKAASLRNMTVNFIGAGDLVDGIFEIVGPTEMMTDKDDNNSLVMILRTQNGNALFAGDMEFAQEQKVMAAAKNLKADVLKVGNHADDDTTSQQLIDRVDAKIALISTSSYEKPETPDAALMQRLENAGMKIYCTEHSDAGIRVYMDKDGVRAEYADWKNAGSIPDGAYITSVLPDEDTVVIENRTSEPFSLNGCYLYSSKGKEYMFFSPDASIPAGGTITVGTNSTKDAVFDILWDDKNVIHDSKEDTVILYDAYGRAISALTANG